MARAEVYKIVANDWKNISGVRLFLDANEARLIKGLVRKVGGMNASKEAYEAAGRISDALINTPDADINIGSTQTLDVQFR